MTVTCPSKHYAQIPECLAVPTPPVFHGVIVIVTVLSVVGFKLFWGEQVSHAISECKLYEVQLLVLSALLPKTCYCSTILLPFFSSPFISFLAILFEFSRQKRDCTNDDDCKCDYQHCCHVHNSV